MVPIVLGAYREDYVDTLPPHSYINVDDFHSIKELTDYLQYLNQNDTAYAAYFAWKELGKIYVSYPWNKFEIMHWILLWQNRLNIHASKPT